MFVRVFCCCNQLSAASGKRLYRCILLNSLLLQFMTLRSVAAHSRRLSGLETSALPQANAGDAAAGSGGAPGQQNSFASAIPHTPSWSARQVYGIANTASSMMARSTLEDLYNDRVI